MPQWKISGSGMYQAFDGYPAALLSGFAVYTTFRLPIAPKLFQAHYERLKQNVEFLGLDWVYSSVSLYEQIIRLVPPDEPVARLTAYAEASFFGDLLQKQPLPCALLLSSRPAPAIPQARLSLQTFRYDRVFSNVKWTGIGDVIYLKRTAMQAGYDDILLINHSGHFTEASTANFFALDASGVLHTPNPERDGCLPGIARSQIFALAERLKLTVSENPLEIAQIPTYSGAFLTNAVQGIVPVGRIDTHALPWPKETQALFQTLREAFIDHTEA
jgi:branched-subunit amino acid aminotransferase/4-amino-4-deoxychorismate lyase